MSGPPPGPPAGHVIRSAARRLSPPPAQNGGAAEELGHAEARRDALRQPGCHLRERERGTQRGAALDHLRKIATDGAHGRVDTSRGGLAHQAIGLHALLDHALVHTVAGDEAGADHREADRPVAVLGAQRLRQPDQPGLGGGVRRLVGGAELAGDRGDEHHVAPPTGEHAREHAVGEQQGGGQVEVDHPRELLAGVGAEVAGQLHAGVVHQQVERPERGLGTLDQRIDLPEVGEVGGQRRGTHPELLELRRERRELRLASRGERDVHALARQAAGEVGAEPPGGPGDQCGATSQLLHGAPSFARRLVYAQRC